MSNQYYFLEPNRKKNYLYTKKVILKYNLRRFFKHYKEDVIDNIKTCWDVFKGVTSFFIKALLLYSLIAFFLYKLVETENLLWIPGFFLALIVILIFKPKRL